MENSYSNSDLQEVVQLKNSIITNQTKRIKIEFTDREINALNSHLKAIAD